MGKLNYYWFEIEDKEDLETAAAMLDTSRRNSLNSNCPVRTVQEKNVWWTDKLNKLRKRTRRKLRVALQNNVQAN